MSSELLPTFGRPTMATTGRDISLALGADSATAVFSGRVDYTVDAGFTSGAFGAAESCRRKRAQIRLDAGTLFRNNTPPWSIPPSRPPGRGLRVGLSQATIEPDGSVAREKIPNRLGPCRKKRESSVGSGEVRTERPGAVRLPAASVRIGASVAIDSVRNRSSESRGRRGRVPDLPRFVERLYSATKNQSIRLNARFSSNPA